jgi:hypothetical protein
MAARAPLPPEMLQLAEALARAQVAEHFAALNTKERPGADRHLRSLQQPRPE